VGLWSTVKCSAERDTLASFGQSTVVLEVVYQGANGWGNQSVQGSVLLLQMGYGGSQATCPEQGPGLSQKSAATQMK